ncbi:hypothetical protein H1D32_13520 [Anaerobacillus sp. CMMVII]|uniref:competence type IV pilus minor pilin ComGG n=1 Tax=Anaerobacillus sp. CMMVII TaxID=2755588 RepID=UPI0021B81807|nr:competence type IV pilus minor pilin ComGG [Anaerobacillus sp. CMMVII]MCT8138674.1 hypothetical protein [Anaerobacillus sp. CMMVII]
MMADQRGVILPTTMVILFLVCSFVAFQLAQYSQEKYLLKEEGDLYTAETLLQMGVVDISKMLHSDSRDHFTGKFHYGEGEVTFVVNKVKTGIKSIHLISKTKENYSKQVLFYYYENKKTVLPWLE